MWRSAVQLRAGLRYGGIAQLVEHLLCKQGVKSSNLFISTKNRLIDFFSVDLFSFCSALEEGVSGTECHTAKKFAMTPKYFNYIKE